MSDEYLVFVEALAGLTIALGFLARKPKPGWHRRPEIVLATLLVLLGGIARLVLVRPTFIHADMLGPGFIDAYLGFPEVSTFRETHGQFGYFAVGAVARVFGRDTDAVFSAMQLIGLGNVVLLGLLATRLARSAWAGVFAVALAITSPALMRVAASEDMHNFALLPGLAGLVCMEHHARTKMRASLVASVISLGLMLHSRQTFYLFAPTAFLLGLAGGGLPMLRRPSFWVAGAAVLSVLVLRAASTAAVEGGALPQILFVLREPRLVPLVFAHHPLFDVVRFGALPIVVIASLAWAPFGGAVPRALLIAFLASFAATYTCGFPSPGVELAQRMPVLALGIVLGACFLARMLESRVPEALRVRAASVLALALALVPAAFPGFSIVRERTTDYLEYVAVEARADALPPSFTLVILPSPAILTGYSRYAGLFRRHGKRVRVVRSDERWAEAPAPRLFLEGVECWTYTFRELTGIRDEVQEAPRSRIHFERALFGREPFPIRPPPRMREECRVLLEGARVVRGATSIADPVDDPPFLMYAASPVPVRFHELAAGR